MTKRDLSQGLQSFFSEINERDLDFIVENFFDILKSALLEGRKIELRGFGRFEVTKAKPYFFTNPKNQQKYYLKDKVRAIFKLGKEFKERLNAPFLAGLDIGTQTIRLLLGKYYAGEVYFLKSFRENVRLGEGLGIDSNISPQARKRALEVLERFKKVLEKYQVKSYYAIGTAVFRKAKNAEEVLEEIKSKTQLEIEILPPEKEAQLVIEGVLYGLKKLGLNLKNFMVVDVGGGSTEFIYFKEGSPEGIKSLEMGAVVLKELFNIRYPLTGRALQSIRSFIRDQLKNLTERSLEKIVATGGSASLMGSLDLKLNRYEPERLNGHIVTAERIERLIHKISEYTLSRIKSIKGMEEGREDIALPGLLIYSEILKYYNQGDLLITTYGILEATLLSLVKRYNNGLTKEKT